MVNKRRDHEAAEAARTRTAHYPQAPLPRQRERMNQSQICVRMPTSPVERDGTSQIPLARLGPAHPSPHGRMPWQHDVRCPSVAPFPATLLERPVPTIGWGASLSVRTPTEIYAPTRRPVAVRNPWPPKLRLPSPQLPLPRGSLSLSLFPHPHLLNPRTPLPHGLGHHLAPHPHSAPLLYPQAAPCMK